MTINTSTFETNLTSVINATTSSTPAETYLLLAKAVQASNEASAAGSPLLANNNLSDVGDAATTRTNLGLGSMAVETATDYLLNSTATSTYMPLAGGTITGDVTISGDVNITGVTTLDEIKENISLSNTTTGGIAFYAKDSSVVFFNSDQTTNRAIDFTGDVNTTLNSLMAVNEVMNCVVLAKQGSTPYQINTFSIDNVAFTPEWLFGMTPANVAEANSITSYSFTIIKEGAGTYTVLGSVVTYK